MNKVKALRTEDTTEFAERLATALNDGFEIASTGMTSSITSGSNYSSLMHTWYAVLVKNTPEPFDL